MILWILPMTAVLASAGKSWSKGHDENNLVDVSGPNSHLERLEVVCSRDHMTVHMHFDQPFYGVVFSHGTPRCVHLGPRSGTTSVSFDIRYDSCGTVEDLGGRFHENTLVIQFDEDILEAWDQAKRLRCEWLESFEKKSSKPTLAISDIDVIELNFQGDDIDCWMEVQEGKGPWARQVGGLVPIGSPLTIVIAINDHSREFDMRIKRCSASDGTGSEIELTDDRGCVLRPSLLTPFVKVRDFGGKATLVAYSHLYAFKFPDKMDVFVHCIVEVCRHGCPDTCSHQLNDYHHHPGKTYDSLESKKIQKLKQLANSKSIHEIHVLGNHQALVSNDAFPLPGRERIREVLVSAAQEQIQHIASKNSSFNVAALGNGKVVSGDIRATFSPTAFKAAQKAKETKSQIQSASSNIQSVFADVENALQAEKNIKLDSHLFQQHSSLENHAAAGHRLVGHDVHWISEAVKKSENDQTHSSFPQKHQVAQPEPATWSADEVKHVSKEFHKPEVDPGIHHGHTPYVGKIQWSSDNSKSTETIGTIIHKQIPQPEPATWSADEVKHVSKEFHKPEVDPGIHHGYTPYVGKIQWSSDNSKSTETVRTILHKQVPQPEPASWTFEEVNPMHSPQAIRHQPHSTKSPEVPKPEPSSWSLDDVKGFNKEDFRFLSLNHKMKSHSYVGAPLNREFVHPYLTSPIPQPVYVPRYNFNSQNMSSPNMMKMMMMMPTMLPPTYQTAHWPQRTTARYLKPKRHHYPYPIPQFSPHQQMMMSVIADRRIDDENEDLLENDSSLYHNLNEGDIKTEPGRIQIGEVAMSSKYLPSDSGTNYHDTSAANEKMTLEDVTSEEIFGSRTTPESKTWEDVLSDAAASTIEHVGSTVTDVFRDLERATLEMNSPESSTKVPGVSGARPAISSFVPPALDVAIGANSESKDRISPGPRALDRRKRSSEPVFGVRQKFRAIAPSDLAFEWNLTTDGAALLKGRRREEIVYGICMSPAGMSASVGFILILTLLSIIASVVFYEHSCQLRNKTSQLSFLTRNFNGQFETLYKITRPYLYSNSRT